MSVLGKPVVRAAVYTRKSSDEGLDQSSTLWMHSMKPAAPISPRSAMKAGNLSRRDMMMGVSQEEH